MSQRLESGFSEPLEKIGEYKEDIKSKDELILNFIRLKERYKAIIEAGCDPEEKTKLQMVVKEIESELIRISSSRQLTAEKITEEVYQFLRYRKMLEEFKPEIYH